MTDELRMEFHKWDGSPHWTYPVERLGQDEHGTWFSGRPGITLVRPGHEPVTETDGFVMLVPADGWWIGHWNLRDGVAIYIDITDAPVITEHTISAADLDLDVVARRDGHVYIDDEDEFEEHRRLFGYPPEVAAEAERTAHWLFDQVSAGCPPFDDSIRAWMSKAEATWSAADA